MTKVLTPAVVDELIREIEKLRARIKSLEETAVTLSERNRELQARLDTIHDAFGYVQTDPTHTVK